MNDKTLNLNPDLKDVNRYTIGECVRELTNKYNYLASTWSEAYEVTLTGKRFFESGGFAKQLEEKNKKIRKIHLFE